MRVPVRRPSGEVGFNMTPMIDVVFQLIIFFLLSSHLAKQETQLALPLPVAESGQPPADETGARLTINVLADGTLLIANRTVLPGDLVDLLRQRRSAHGARLEVCIRGDRSVAYKHLEPVMLACVRAE